jgi:hypothetical protein
MRVRLLAAMLGVLAVGVANTASAQDAGRPRGAAARRRGASTTTPPASDASPAEATPEASGAAPSGTSTAAGATTLDGGAAAPAFPAAGTPGPSTATDGGAPPVSGEAYVIRLRDLEQRINELKEEIFRSKARLSLLAESVLQNVVGGARAMVQHENEMGPSFRLMRAVYALDGAPITTRSDDNGSLADLHDFPVYNGQIGAGDHTLTVNLEYQGHGYGIFSYVKGYTFRVRSTQSFSVPEGKAIQIRVVAFEKGGPTTPPEERPAVRYIQRIMSLRDATEGEAAASGGSGGSSGSGGSGASTGGASGATPPRTGTGNNP